MNYRDAIKESMKMLAEDERTIFIGYNICRGSNAYGTLKEIPDYKKIETPVAENLMSGLAIGMSIEGFRPVVFFERHDFTLIALDGLVNHLDKIEKMSHGQFKLPVTIRAVIGAKKPLDAGPQHTQNFSEIFRNIFSFPVYSPKKPQEVLDVYRKINGIDGPVMIIEERDLYDSI